VKWPSVTNALDANPYQSPLQPSSPQPAQRWPLGWGLGAGPWSGRPWLKRIALTLSLAITMTGFGIAVFLASMWLAELLQQRWRMDDDWTWLALPLGAALGIALWLKYRRRIWIHVCSLVLSLWLAVSITSIFTTATPPGMQGLGIAIGKAIAAATLYVAGIMGLISLAIAAAIVVAITFKGTPR
jgi:hypothetical protein